MPKIQRLAARFSRASLAGCLLLCLLLLVSDSASELQGRVSAQSSCPQLNVPATTHGFSTTVGLPNGDHFLLPQPFTLTSTSSATVPGLRNFFVNAANFGGDAAAIGGFAGTNLSGVSLEQPNSSVTFVSCLDSVWDIGFEFASAGSTVGDTVTFFLQRSDGTGVINLAVFTHESGGVRVTALNPNLQLFRNDRLATGAGRLQVGDLIPLNIPAGAAGNRSDLLTIAFEMRADSPLNDCFQFGTTIARGSGVGTSSLVFTDFLVKRMEQAGDRARPDTGLLGGLTGGFPTALVCPVNCPACQPGPTPCPVIFNPATTHGFATSPTLPQGDSFLLPQPFVLTVPQRGPIAGFNTFPVNAATFGGDAVAIGGFAGTNLTGFGFATPGGTVTALSCLDSLWDIGFELASTGATEGDIVRFFLQNPSGSSLISLAVFTYESGGVRVTSLNPNVKLFRENRLANGPGQIQPGEFIPFSAAAGAAGNRTPLLVLAFEMRDDSPLNGCFQFGASITRGSGVGTSSVVFTDFMLKRMEQAGDRDRLGAGLLGGLTGGFPTALVCPELCPICPELPPVLVCPPNQTACPPAGGTSATVSYPIPVGATCTPASGASFPPGVTTVTCTATNSGGTTSCSFTVTVTPNVTLVCPANVSVTATGASGATVTYSAPTVTPAGTAVTCTPASGTTFPVGTTTVTCTASNVCGTATCRFTVTVQQAKCDTFCWHSPRWWLLNPNRIPQGNVLISGVNSNLSVSTNNVSLIQLALQGNPTGFSLTPPQRFNQEYVAAQLNLLAAGGGGSVVNANVLWANLSCYNINFAPVTLSNGAVLSNASMVKDLFMQAQFAVQQNRFADFAALAALLDRFNGNDPLSCN